MGRAAGTATGMGAAAVALRRRRSSLAEGDPVDSKISLAVVEGEFEHQPEQTALGVADGGSPPILVETKGFGLAVYALIFLNALQMGMEVDLRGAPWTELWEVSEHLFTFAFLVEMLLKLQAYGFVGYWLDGWNRLDGALVVLAMLDVWLLRLVLEPGSSGGDGGSMQQFSILRLLRVLRVVRMVKFLRAFRELWVIVKGILDSFRTMAWVSLLLLILLYVGGIFCVYTVGRSDLYPHTDTERTETWMGVNVFNAYQTFGSLPRAMYSLFCIVILAEWMEFGRALIEYQWYLFPFFCGFIIFTTFGVMNVIIGVIVDNTMEAAKAVEREQDEADKQSKLEKLAKIQDIIFALDEDGDGDITMEEIDVGMKDPGIKSLLKDMDFPINFTASEFMSLLDRDSDGCLTKDEFMISFYRMISSMQSPFQQGVLMTANLNCIRNSVWALRNSTILKKPGTSVAPDGTPTQQPDSEHGGGGAATGEEGETTLDWGTAVATRLERVERWQEQHLERERDLLEELLGVVLERLELGQEEIKERLVVVEATAEPAAAAAAAQAKKSGPGSPRNLTSSPSPIKPRGELFPSPRLPPREEGSGGGGGRGGEQQDGDLASTSPPGGAEKEKAASPSKLRGPGGWANYEAMARLEHLTAGQQELKDGQQKMAERLGALEEGQASLLKALESLLLASAPRKPAEKGAPSASGDALGGTLGLDPQEGDTGGAGQATPTSGAVTAPMLIPPRRGLGSRCCQVSSSGKKVTPNTLD